MLFMMYVWFVKFDHISNISSDLYVLKTKKKCQKIHEIRYPHISQHEVHPHLRRIHFCASSFQLQGFGRLRSIQPSYDEIMGHTWNTSRNMSWNISWDSYLGSENGV